MTNDVNLGIGLASGMFFAAVENTPLPTSPSEALSEAWEEVGAISEDGITLQAGHELEPIRNWAKVIERLKPSEDNPKIQAPIIETTEKVFEELWGAENVTTAAATTSHGNQFKVELSAQTAPGKRAFLFLMKDGDDMIMLGTKSGILGTVDDVSFAPGDPITWTATIEAEKWTILKDDGQLATSV